MTRVTNFSAQGHIHTRILTMFLTILQPTAEQQLKTVSFGHESKSLHEYIFMIIDI